MYAEKINKTVKGVMIMESSLAAEGLASKLSYCFLTGLFKVQMSGGEGLFYFFLTNINPCIYFSYMNTGKGANRDHILKRCKDTVSSSSLKSFCVFMSSEFAFITTSFIPLSSSFCKKKGKCEVVLISQHLRTTQFTFQCFLNFG